MTMVAEAMFGCNGSVADLPCAPVLLEETLDYACNAAEQQILPSLQISARHFKDSPHHGVLLRSYPTVVDTL
jgi:hypothetical protein